jgi:hypothetical protein
MSLIKDFKTFLKNFFISKKIYLSKINEKKVLEFLKKIKIIDSGHKLIRIGSSSDGGYLIPNILDQIEFCFSPGVGNSTTFENHLLNYNIKSFLADNTVDYFGEHNFIKKNLNSFSDEKNITLEDWVNEKLSSRSNNNLLLQMDIEGSEIECLYNSSINCLDRFKIIIIEFHHFHYILNYLGLKIYNDLFDKILKTHHIVHIHPNNVGPTLNICNNEITNGYEITFINKKDCKYVKKINYSFPHKYDYKNVSSLPDVKCPKIFYI